MADGVVRGRYDWIGDIPDGTVGASGMGPEEGGCGRWRYHEKQLFIAKGNGFSYRSIESTNRA